jgi:predicted nucleic acid-binding protein
MYLLDTNVLSAGAPTKARPDEAVRDWIREHSHALYLSVVTLLELSYGAELARHRGAAARAAQLQLWLNAITGHYSQRVLPVDLTVALRAGELIAIARAVGARVGSDDAMIAATADLRGFVVLTANAPHFAPMSVAHLNPFRELPPVC